MKYAPLILAVLLAACSSKEEPKQVFPNEKMTAQVKDKNAKQLLDSGVKWITVSCTFRGMGTDTTTPDKKLEIWYETSYGQVQILKDETCANPQNLIMIGLQEGHRGGDDFYQVDTARDYEYDLINGIVTDVLTDIKTKGSKL